MVIYAETFQDYISFISQDMSCNVFISYVLFKVKLLGHNYFILSDKAQMLYFYCVGIVIELSQNWKWTMKERTRYELLKLYKTPSA